MSTNVQDEDDLCPEHFPDPRTRGFDSASASDDLPPEEACNNQCVKFYNELNELDVQEVVLMSLRCFTCFLCLVGLMTVLIHIFRGNRLKSWPLYLVVVITIFVWIGLSLYQQYIEKHFVCQPQNRLYYNDNIVYYNLIQNLLHGFSLFLVVLLLAHLSDRQHRSHWMGLIAIVILVPLIYSIGVLIRDLKVEHDFHQPWDWYVNLATQSLQFFLYNIITTILLFIMSRSICTSTLYGSYSEQRSQAVICIARWTYVFFLLHNFTACALYITRVFVYLDNGGQLTWETDFETREMMNKLLGGLDEATYFVIVLAVPLSYCFGACIFGNSRDTVDMEMKQVDKIYTDVWTTPSARNTTTTTNTNGSKVISSPTGTQMTSTNISSSNSSGNTASSNFLVTRI